MQNFTAEAILALGSSQASSSSSMPLTPTPAHPKPRPQQQHPAQSNALFMRAGPRAFKPAAGRPPMGAFLKNKKPAAAASTMPPPPPPKLAPVQAPVQVEPESMPQPQPEPESEPESQGELKFTSLFEDLNDDQDELSEAEEAVEKTDDEGTHDGYDEPKEFASQSVNEFESDREHEFVDAGSHKRTSDTWDDEGDLEDDEEPEEQIESPAAKRVRIETVPHEQHEQWTQVETYASPEASQAAHGGSSRPEQPANANATDPTPHTTRAAKLIAEMTDPNPWEGATLEEWKAGGDALAARFGDLMVRVVRLVERKAMRQAALQAEMDAHKASLAERSRKMDGTGKNVDSWVALLSGPKN